MQNLIGFGIMLILIGFVLIVLGSVLSAEKSNIKVAAGGFIGPIPFGFFTDKKMFYILLAVLAVFVLFWIIFRAR